MRKKTTKTTFTKKSIYVDISELLVPHDGFTEAMGRMEALYRRAHIRDMPQCLTLVGETGTGKTSLLKQFAGKYPPTRTPEGLNIPVLMITAPALPYPKTLAGKILEKLGSPEIRSSRESEEDRTRRAVKLTKSCGVKMIIMEEFQHFIERGDKRITIAADWLKVFLDETKVMAVISGLESSTQILHRNEQLGRRFAANLRLHRFDWEDREHRVQFLGILETFQAAMGDVSVPDLGSDQVAFRMYLATGGLISNIPKLLDFALMDAEIDGRFEIGMDHLATAWQKSIYQPEHGRFNPFRLNNHLKVDVDIDPNLLAFARSITAKHANRK